MGSLMKLDATINILINESGKLVKVILNSFMLRISATQKKEKESLFILALGIIH